jgi:hypothetical protein
MNTSDNISAFFDKYDIVELYMPSFLNFISEDCHEKAKRSFNEFISEHRDRILWYPDGTLQISSPDSIRAFSNTEYYQYARQKEMDIIMNPHDLLNKPIHRILDRITYTSLPPYPKQNFLIHLYEPVLAQLPDESIFFHLRDELHLERKQFYESPIESVPIHVIFKNKLNKKAQKYFTHTIAQWESSIKNYELFDGCQIKIKDNEILFYSNIAFFTVDASQSNQIVFNWLILLLIVFCRYALITEVFFTRLRYVEEYIDEEIFSKIAEEYKSMYPLPVALRMTQKQSQSFTKYKLITFENAYNLTSQKQIKMNLTQLNQKIISTVQNNNDEKIAGLEKDCDNIFFDNIVQHTFLNSDKFPILMATKFSYDHLWITIFFDSIFPDQIKQLINDASLWIQMGHKGGFGGTFSASYKPEFDKEHDVLHMFVDCGNVNITLSFSILINIAETWDIYGINVRAMLFDKEIRTLCLPDNFERAADGKNRTGNWRE